MVCNMKLEAVTPKDCKWRGEPLGDPCLILGMMGMGLFLRQPLMKGERGFFGAATLPEHTFLDNSTERKEEPSR